MSQAVAARFRPHLRVLTERRVPEPTFVVAWTGVDYWLRVDVPAAVLIKSRRQRLREVGRIVRAHYAERQGSAVPFGAITGYLFRTLPERAIRFNTEGAVAGEHAGPVLRGEARLHLR